jgi:hypothetical protein
LLIISSNLVIKPWLSVDSVGQRGARRRDRKDLRYATKTHCVLLEYSTLNFKLKSALNEYSSKKQLYLR